MNKKNILSRIKNKINVKINIKIKMYGVVMYFKKMHYDKKFFEQTVDLSDWDNVFPNACISSYKHINCDDDFKKLSQKLYLEGRTCLSVREMWNIYNWVKKTEHINGDIAEVGVYKGGSAKIISEVNKNRKLYLFDTFEGIPENDFSINQINNGELCDSSLDNVKSYLSKYNNIEYFKGVFPDSAANFKKQAYSFVHLDTDIYEATLAGLEYFYPLVRPGGIILTHDYRTKHLPGVKKAFDEFFKNKPETIIELWDTQALITKI